MQPCVFVAGPNKLDVLLVSHVPTRCEISTDRPSLRAVALLLSLPLPHRVLPLHRQCSSQPTSCSYIYTPWLYWHHQSQRTALQRVSGRRSAKFVGLSILAVIGRKKRRQLFLNGKVLHPRSLPVNSMGPALDEFYKGPEVWCLMSLDK